MNTKEEVKSKVKEAFNNYAEEKFGKSKGKGKRGRGHRGGRQTLFNRGTKFNDVAYYTRNKSITDAFCNLPFSWLVGNPLVNLNTNLKIKIPAIVSYMIDWVSTLGTNYSIEAASSNNSDDDDILDQVATIIYSQMRRSNSGSTNGIQHVDVLISNLIASIDICVNVHYIHRIFKIANSFSWRNRLIPRYIFEHHLGIDYDDFIAHQANYRGEFNTVVAFARTIRTLADFPFINAIMDEFDNIFKDSDTDNGREQLLISIKPVHHIYDPVGTESAPGGCVRLMKVGDIHDYMDDEVNNRLVWTGVPKENTGSDYVHIKFSVLLDILKTQINALITDNDFNLIQADIEKAFGEQSGYIVVDPISDTSVLTPIYSGEFNLMFQNGKFHKHGYDINNDWEFNVMNDFHGSPFTTLMPNAIVNTIYQKAASEGGNIKLKTALFWLAPNGDVDSDNHLMNLLNMEADHPTTDDVVIATRFKHTINVVFGAELINANIPSEFVVNASAPYQVPQNCSNFICFGGNVTYVETKRDSVDIQFTQWSNTTNQSPSLLLGLEHPPMHLNFAGLVLNDNINNLRGIDDSELYPIQKSCFLSLWNLPNKTNL